MDRKCAKYCGWRSIRDHLVKEWFLISNAPACYSALATEASTHVDDPDHLRLIEGVWTFDLQTVSIPRNWWRLCSRWLRSVLSHTFAVLLCQQAGRAAPLRFADLVSG